MRVALTGTPGTGKTSVATVLKKQGYTIVRLHALARKNNCIVGVDEKRNSQLIDIDKVNSIVKKNFTTDALVFFEGHIAHLLNSMEKVIILRCHPKELKKRLMRKRWSRKKVLENVQAEILDIILCESTEQYPFENIFELETTNKSVKEVTAAINEIVENHFRPTTSYSIGQIDWSEEIFNEHHR